MRLNTLGNMVQNEWLRMSQRFPGIVLDEFGIMPNHFHGVIQITVDNQPPTKVINNFEAFGRPVKTSIPTIVRSFKAAVTLRARRMIGDSSLKLWHTNYFERVIRNEQGLLAARSYIQANPANWSADQENPDRENGEFSGLGTAN
ncbi:transposase [bacterium]|nr:transposase [bacterium]